MKCIIIYFSQSGNTEKTAYAIQKGLASQVEKCDIVSLDHADPKGLAGYDLIGIGSPVWSGVPFNVKRFVLEMPVLKGKQAFTFATHGVLPYRFLPNMMRLLNKRGLTVIGTRLWYCSANHPLMPKPYLTDGHPDEIDLNEAEDFGKSLPETARRIAAGETHLIPPLPPIPPPRKLKRIVPEKSFIKEKCTYPECTLCVDNCRLKIIDLSVSPPVFPERCQPCFFCELICPEGAIIIDYKKYAGLEIKRARTVFTEALKKAEAEGRFRRLVPEDRVGWDTPFYEVYPEHPRWKINMKNKK